MSEKEHPALTAAKNSWRCVMGKKRDEWFSLMAPDVCIEDPIGVSPLDPTGKGIHGREGLEKFWAANVEPNTIVIEPQESYAAGLESGHVLVLTTTFPNGMKAVQDG